MAISGTIQNPQIEKAIRTFKCKVKRAAVDNVIHRDPRWEEWRVLAETKDGARRIAEYHFYRAHKIIIMD